MSEEIKTVETTETIPVEEVLEEKKKTRKTTKKTDKTVSEATKTERTGVVVNCQFLRFRKDPVIANNVIRELVAGDKVVIDDTYVSDEFFKITFNGETGFVMKKYIEVK